MSAMSSVPKLSCWLAHIQAETKQKRANKLRQRLDLSLTSTWRSFEDLVACLVASNALEADTLRALPLGHVARQIHGENELWLAIVLTHPAVQVCCAVLCCAVLCCAVLCCAVLCCAVLCCAVLCCAVLRCAVRYALCPAPCTALCPVLCALCCAASDRRVALSGSWLQAQNVACLLQQFTHLGHSLVSGTCWLMRFQACDNHVTA